MSNIENIKNLIFKILDKKYCNETQLEGLVSRAFSCIRNGSLYTEVQLEMALEAITMIIESQFFYLIAKEDNIEAIMCFFEDEEAKLDKVIKLAFLVRKLTANGKTKPSFYDFIPKIVEVLGKLANNVLDEGDNEAC